MEQKQIQVMEAPEVAEFTLDDILPIAIILIVVGIAIAFGLNVMADIKADFTAGTAEFNATEDAITGVGNIADKLPLIATVVVAAIIIGVLIRYFYNNNVSR